MHDNEIKELIKSNSGVVDADLKNIAGNIQGVKKSIDKNRDKRPWLTPVFSLAFLIVGLLAGPFLGHIYDQRYEVNPMLNLLAIEIQANQQTITETTGINSVLSTAQSGKPYDPANTFEIQDSVFKSYLNQMDLLDDNTRTDIAGVYEEFYFADSECMLLHQINDDYLAGSPSVNKTSLSAAVSKCASIVEDAFGESDMVLAEIEVTDKVNIPAYINEDFVDKVKPGVISYLNNLPAGATTSFVSVINSDGDDGGFATAVELLRLGAKIYEPITMGEFQK